MSKFILAVEVCSFGAGIFSFSTRHEFEIESVQGFPGDGRQKEV